ncbi:MAG: type I pullulanase, partial [Eubacteriaceae bacterium]|nr:type I pullulanase [Eubacteriaceae bacterium]
MMHKAYKITEKKLGCSYSPESTVFRVWAPSRQVVKLMVYNNFLEVRRKLYPMIKDEDGVFEVEIAGDLKGKFYTFQLDLKLEVTDPYAVASSLNSLKSAVVDLKETNPEGWEDHVVQNDSTECDVIVYEVHMKDFTGHETSGAKFKGKYLGMAENDTWFEDVKTGLSHLKELGVTHVHLLPIYDYLTVDESAEAFNDEYNYNWGYDPEHYNVPEGSYATEPSNPISRIKELKTLILEMHKAGFKVIMDVVYNHTYRGKDSNFNMLAPNYYFRRREDGTFSDGSGCGNELATENDMVRKFIIESLVFWATEYKIDGFRFDLMALIDIDTVKEAVDVLRLINKDIMIFGEPWTAGLTTLPDNKTTTKGRQSELNFALLNDTYLNSIKGDGNGGGRGFVHGNSDCKNDAETSIAGSIFYDYGHIGFAAKPSESINYINSHDNLILFDKMRKVFPYISDVDNDKLNRLAFGVLFTSQGIPLIHAGNEFLREKHMIDNSYNASFKINAIDWSLKKKNAGFYSYFKDLIALRKERFEFRMNTTQEIKEKLKFFHIPSSSNCIGLTIETDHKFLLVVYNAHENPSL